MKSKKPTTYRLSLLARKIIELREGAGLTQRQLAKRMRTSQQAISRLEKGDYSGYTLKTLHRLARAIGMDLSIDFVSREDRYSSRGPNGNGNGKQKPFYRPNENAYHHLLYHPRHEHDSCGVGFVAHIAGKASHGVLEKGIQSVVNVTHRGAIAADAKTGDGAGVLTQLPKKLLEREAERMGRKLSCFEDLAIGMIFLPGHHPKAQASARKVVEKEIKRAGLELLGWRKVPVNIDALGKKAEETRPEIEQVFILRSEKVARDRYEHLLYTTRRRIEKRASAEGEESLYIASFSSKTLVYKGLLVAPQLKTFYPDLADPLYETAVCLFHQRYSTNTFPDWIRAQPFRMLAHNGEINTLQGNQNWMRARESELGSSIWKEDLPELTPVIQKGGSDSQDLDNVVEFLVRSGRDILHTHMILVPEAWENMPYMDPVLRSFYEYHGCLTEPWDGPAALAFTDGDWVGATLDRNGLRPARYQITDDGVMIMGSEAGMVPTEEKRVVERGRLGPGQMIAIDLTQGKLYRNDEIKDVAKKRRPYGDWLKGQILKLDEIPPVSDGGASEEPNSLPLVNRQQAFGFGSEDLKEVIRAMVDKAQEPTFSMGDDTPLSVLSDKPRLLYTYFKQRFAQVTNPPIDPVRERLVMSLNMYLGRRHSILTETPQHAKLIELSSPLLTTGEMAKIRAVRDPDFKSVTLPALFPKDREEKGLEEGVHALCIQAERAVDEGSSVLILSDRGMQKDLIAIPMLLAVAAVHHHLIRQGKRMRCSIVAESGEPRDVHHFAALIGYGASAIYPYLIFETILGLIDRGELKEMTLEKAVGRFKEALHKGLLKIMSKMGISTLTSYHGAQIFEAIGLGRSCIDRYFTGTFSQVGGIGLEEIAKDALHWHTQAFSEDLKTLEVQGHFRARRGGEHHAFNNQMIQLLHKAIRHEDAEAYRQYAKLVNEQPVTTLRNLLDFKKQKPIPIEEVESVESIVRHFNTGGMSHGALSREAHEQLAIAMNRLGGRSNSGEGGESLHRYKPYPNGDSASSAIKQVASGRFGVTADYLVHCTGIEIKMAQGSKPGEGGQLPGKKVSEEIATNRFTVPGVTLISPPPHHDIYSIEDLAELIYDLKQVNPKAKICVKLVAESGVGTIAAGVAKGYADYIQISGHDGGTGASPYSSIKHAGAPWELGLAETQQVLVLNGLRDRVRLRVDGGLKTGRDVVIGGILGAEEFGFGTVAVVTTGCVMARQCHLNTCPVGVATQREDLRKKYVGDPDHTVNFCKFVAQEVRELMAQLGIRKLKDLCGRTDLLVTKKRSGIHKATQLDLGRILASPDPEGRKPQYHLVERNDRSGDAPLNEIMIRDGEPALERREKVRLNYKVRNIHRALGTRLSGEIALRYGRKGLDRDTIRLNLTGSAGQSLGAFLMQGVRITLRGEANDYVGKGLCGGEIVISPGEGAQFKSHQNSIVGNTVLYGATSGKLYAAGKGGERFCVRNSGAEAVVEGVGDHGCEYMTGGAVLVLGETGRNFGAGMTGGIAYVLDEGNCFEHRFNPELVVIERINENGDIDRIRGMIEAHFEMTASKRAREILDRWEDYKPLFWKVVPRETIARQKRETPAVAKV